MREPLWNPRNIRRYFRFECTYAHVCIQTITNLNNTERWLPLIGKASDLYK